MKKLVLSLMLLGAFGVTEAYAAKTIKAKRVTTARAQAIAPAPAKDPMCKVLLPDQVSTSQRDQYRCYR
jgi:hypothetical protein